MNWKKVDAAVEFFVRNPFWRKFYENAPSEPCRRRVALDFYFSTFWDDAHEDEAFFREMEKTEAELGLEDWKYLLKYQGNNPGRVKIRKKIEELSGTQETGI